MEVTLHNHVRIGTEAKPVIPNIEFKILCDKVKAGRVDYYDDIKEKYSMIPFQHGLIKQYILKHEANLSSLL